MIVQPATVIAWHRQGFRLFWTWKSRRRKGRPKATTEIRALIRSMSQQLRNAFPFDDGPRYLLHDRDTAFAGVAGTLRAMGIQDVVTAARSPWQNAYLERFLGSLRRECLDHVMVRVCM